MIDPITCSTKPFQQTFLYAKENLGRLFIASEVFV